MKNKYLILLVSLLLLGTIVSSCVKDVEDEDKAMVFLGSESYFKFFDEIIPDTLAVLFDEYADSVLHYDYLNLYNVSFIATKMEGSYKLEQDPVPNIEFEDPFRDTIESDNFAAKLRLSGQNNCIISLEMIFDTIVDTKVTSIQYKMYESIVADTMYVVGEVGDTGRFMMYGNAENVLKRGNYSEDDFTFDVSYQEYNYKSNIILVGNKTDKGISDITYFEYVSENENSYVGNHLYPEVGSIRAFRDIDRISNFY